MPPIRLETRPGLNSIDVDRTSITTVHIWLAQGQLVAHISLLRNEARELGMQLIETANRPFDHHQREESDG